MSGAGFILAINLSVAGLLATVFLSFALYEKSYVCARWFALAYVFGMANFVLEFVVHALDAPRAVVTLSYAAVLAAMVAFNVGLARMYALRPPWRMLGLVCLVAIAVKLAVVDVLDRGSFVRMTLYQAPYFLLQMIAAATVLSGDRMRTSDRLLGALLALSALQFMTKPFLSAGFGGTGTGPEQYLATQYALISQTIATVFALAIALFLLIVLAADLLAEIKSRSITDALSGVLNRRGFQERLQAIVEDPEARRQALSVVVCDLDNFKSINDTYGHAVGDKVIAAFADTLARAAASRYLVARIGGEEFAVLLSGATVSTARQFAEQVRIAFAVRAIDGLEKGSSVTASFGVAERADDEHWADLLDRADRALYAAKRDGRDCVRLAPAPRPAREDRTVQPPQMLRSLA